MRTYTVIYAHGAHLDPTSIFNGVRRLTLAELRERLPREIEASGTATPGEWEAALETLLRELEAGRDGSGALMDAEAALGIVMDPEQPDDEEGI